MNQLGIGRGSPIRFLPAGAAVVIIAASVALANSVLPVHRTRMVGVANLVATQPPSRFSSTPAKSGADNPLHSQFIEVRDAAKKSSLQTASYATRWNGPTAGSFASVVVFVLPSEGQASSLSREVDQSAIGPDSYSRESYRPHAEFRLPRVRGALGAIYEPASSSSQPQRLCVITEQFGRAVTLILVADTVNADQVGNEGGGLAEAEFARLVPGVPRLRLSKETAWPAAGLSLWVVATILLAFTVAVLPGWQQRSRLRNEAGRSQASKKQVQVRGSRVLDRVGNRR